MDESVQLEIDPQPRHTSMPVYIEGMFGWLHQPRFGAETETAVLICSAQNRDALDSHRFLRVLADEFTDAGYPALRFDYPNTGDSLDLANYPEAAGNLWLAWQYGLRVALEYLLAATRAKRLIICGLRVGATLATIVAKDRKDVCGLILLAPVIRGESYIRQLWVESRLRQGDSKQLRDGFAFMDCNFTEQAVQAFIHADLRKVEMTPGRHVLVCPQSPSAPLTACEQAWKQQGALLSSLDFAGLEPLLLHDPERVLPPADFTRLLDWAKLNIPPQRVFQADANNLSEAKPKTAQLEIDGLVETPISFGSTNSLFGMLCEPLEGTKDIAVILCPAGRTPHYGVARSSVYLARQLAQSGIASLRIDFAGLGDSLAPPGKEFSITDPFDYRLPDIQAALDRVQAMGYRRFAVHGLCSSAFHSFHAALVDSRIGSLLLVNMPLFQQADGPESKVAMRAALPFSYYRDRLTNKQVWIRFFSGQTDLLSLLRGRLSRCRENLGRPKQVPSEELTASVDSASYTRWTISQLSRRGVKIQFIFGPDEPGLYAVEDAYGPGGKGLLQLDHVTIRIADTFDHIMSVPDSQNVVLASMLEELLSWPDLVPA